MFMFSPTSTPCVWVSCPPPVTLEGNWEGGEQLVWGEEEDTRVLLWRWLAQLYFITQKNETTRTSPQFAEATWWGLGGLQPMLVGPRPGPVQHLRPLKWRRAGLGLRK